MKLLIGIFVAAVLIIVVPSVQADIITATLPEYSSPYHDPGVYYDPYLVGTFTFDVDGLTILSANISGQWGNSIASTSAHNELYLDGVALADTHDASPDPYFNSYVPWSYDFAESELGALADGSADFVTVQTSEFVVRLGETTLEIDAVGIDVEKTLVEIYDYDSDGLVELGEPTAFWLSIVVTNPNNDYAIEDVVVKDRLGGDLGFADSEPWPSSIDTKGKTEKVFLEWEIGTLAPGDSATIDLLVYTDINTGTGNGKKAGHQEYTSTGEHELNSGATAKGTVEGKEVCGTSDSIIVEVVEPD